MCATVLIIMCFIMLVLLILKEIFLWSPDFSLHSNSDPLPWETFNMLRNGDVLCCRRSHWFWTAPICLIKRLPIYLVLSFSWFLGRGKVARKCIELLLYVVPWGVREWDLLLIVLVCRGVVAWVYLQGDEPVRYFCIDFFSQAIKLNTSNFIPQLLLCNLKLPPQRNSTGKSAKNFNLSFNNQWICHHQIVVRPKLLLELYEIKFGSTCLFMCEI